MGIAGDACEAMIPSALTSHGAMLPPLGTRAFYPQTSRWSGSHLATRCRAMRRQEEPQRIEVWVELRVGPIF